MEPILIDVPEELSTPRLRLRIPRTGEGPIVTAAVRASLPELQPYMPWAKSDYSDDDGELWVRRVQARFILREQITYMIVDRETGEFLGGLGPHHIDWKIRKCEVGYWLRTDRVGSGLMSEALNAVVGLLDKIGLRRVEVRCDVANARSAAVAERCGFELEGITRMDDLDPAGKPRSTKVFSKIVGDTSGD